MIYPVPKKKSKPVFNKTLLIVCSECGGTIYHGRLTSIYFIVKYKKKCPNCGKDLTSKINLNDIEISTKNKPYNMSEAYIPLAGVIING